MIYALCIYICIGIYPSFCGDSIAVHGTDSQLDMGMLLDG